MSIKELLYSFKTTQNKKTELVYFYVNGKRVSHLNYWNLKDRCHRLDSFSNNETKKFRYSHSTGYILSNPPF